MASTMSSGSSTLSCSCSSSYSISNMDCVCEFNSKSTMGYPDLQPLVDTELYKENEVRVIEKIRKKNDEIISTRSCDPTVMFSAIQFELKILNDIAIRRDKNEIYAQQYDIEMDVLRRGICVHKKVSALSPEAEKSVEHYVERFETAIEKFCKLFRLSDKPFHIAARWYRDRGDLEEASKRLTQGLKIHPGSECLLCELFHLDLDIEMHGNFEKKEYKCAISVLHTYVTLISKRVDTLFMFKLLSITDLYQNPNIEQFRNNLIDLMRDELGHLEEFWFKLALRELEGKHYDPRPKIFQRMQEPNRTAAENCIEVFKEGCRRIQTPSMWKHFISTLFTENVFDDNIRVTYIKDAFQISINTKEEFLNDYLLSKIPDIRNVDVKDKEELYELALRASPDTQSIWLDYLQIFKERDHQDQMEDIFFRGILSLGDDAWPLWMQKIQYYKNFESDDLNETIQQIYSNGVDNQPRKIVEALQLEYLAWLVEKKTMADVRKAFSSFTDIITMECLQKMLEYERACNAPDIKLITKILERICKTYGHRDSECWMNYVEHLIEHNPSRVDAVYKEAVRSLDKEHGASFILKFNLLDWTAQ